jgi:hypothetical protein
MARKQLLLYDGKRLRFLGGLLGREEEVAPGGYYTEYQTVYNAFSTKPAAAVATAQNTMIKTLVDNSIWTGKFDVFYVFANNASDNALINWVKPGTYNASNIHSTAFVAYEGFTSDGANDYIDLNWNPSINAVNYKVWDAGVGTYIRTNTYGDLIEVGMSDGTNTTMIQAAYYNGSNTFFYSRLNSVSYKLVFQTDNASGMKITTRVAYIQCYGYNNKTQYSFESEGEVIPNAKMYACCWNLSGVASEFSLNQLSLVFAGAALNISDVSILTDAFEVYMDSNGKGVIP